MLRLQRLLLLCLFLSPVWDAFAQSASQILPPRQDAYIANTTAGKTTAYGTTDAQKLLTKYSSVDFKRKIYLQFDVSSLAAKEIESVTLRLYGGMTAADQDVTVSVYPLANNSWDEASLTWNTRPEEGTPTAIDQVTLQPNQNRYYEWSNLASHVQQQIAAGNTTFSLRVENSNSATAPTVTWSSKEAAENQPQLVVTYKEPSGEVSNKVEIREQNGTYTLYRNGSPYVIKGAGGQMYLDRIAAYGGNSFRLWSTNAMQSESGKTPLELLDEAHALGLTVTMGLWVTHPRHSATFYDDPARVSAQLEGFREDVRQYKDHPALLMWAVGNEVHHETSNTKVWDAVEEIAQMIKAEDPNHPVTTVTANINSTLVATLKAKVPSIDALGINAYGNELTNMPQKVRNSGWDKAYFMGEFGPTNHWQVSGTDWDAKYEPLNTAKAQTYLSGYRAFEADTERCIGTYVFKWGWKWQRTYSWINLFTSTGVETEAVDVLHFLWKGEWPANRTPRASAITLNGKTPGGRGDTLVATNTYQASVTATDADNDALTYEWRLYPEGGSTASGGDAETTPPVLAGVIVENGNSTVELKMPALGGAYRLYAFVYDGNNNVGISNYPFFVKPKPHEVGDDTLVAVADTYVRGGDYANRTFGGEPLMISKMAGGISFVRESFVKFNISSLIREQSNIYLNIYGDVGNGTEVEVYTLNDNNWDETATTWNTKPQRGEKIASLLIPDNSKGYFLWDVSSTVNQAISNGQQHISFMLQAKETTEKEIKWNTKEAEKNPPLLVFPDMVTSMKDAEKLTHFEVYPNPATDELTVKLLNSYAASVMEVYNNMGQRVLVQQAMGKSEKETIRVSPLPAGIYFLRVTGKTGTSVKKFIKQ